MSEQIADPIAEPAPTPPAPTTIDKLKISGPAIAMTAGAGIAGGGILDEDLSEMLTDITTALGWTWLAHPASWAGFFIALGGFIAHIIHQRSVNKGKVQP